MQCFKIAGVALFPFGKDITNDKSGAGSFLLNVIWVIFAGIWIFLTHITLALGLAVTIIGIPWARAALTIALYTLLPFGHTVVERPTGVGVGPLGFIGNLIWLLLAGWWLALGHLIAAIIFAITIIGLPFAWAHLKLAGLALWPVGREIVPV